MTKVKSSPYCLVEWLREENNHGSIAMDYDDVQYEEALTEDTVQENLEPVTLQCMHGGDYNVETETPNYLPSFDISVEVQDLLANTAAVATVRVVEYLIEHQREFFNPYMDVSRLDNPNIEYTCGGCYQTGHSKLVNFDVDPSFWANLRRKQLTTRASIVFHLVQMHHCAAPERHQRPGNVLEWTSPAEWHQPLRPSVYPPDECRSTPVFRYVRCAYALTPTSPYPPLKALHIWHWNPPPYDYSKESERDEFIYDPFGAHCMISRVAQDYLEYLGQTVLAVANDGQRHFADIFGYDPGRGLLFGWLRVQGRNDTFSAFALPGAFDDESDITLPPFIRIQVETIGYPQHISRPSPTQRRAPVPVRCRNTSNHSSINLVPELEVYVSSMLEDETLTVVVATLILNHLIQHQLIHPLLIQILQELLKRDDIYVLGWFIHASGDRHF
jgi:hypothetical protein